MQHCLAQNDTKWMPTKDKSGQKCMKLNFVNNPRESVISHNFVNDPRESESGEFVISKNQKDRLEWLAS